MKKEIIRLFFNLTICITLLLTLPGCWNARELNDLLIVAGIGIDKAEEPGSISLITQVVKPGEMKKASKDSTGGEGKSFWNIRSDAKTVFDAFRESTHVTSNRMYLSHTQVIVFGENIAAEGVQKYLDFFMRSHETRPTIIIMVSRGAASEVMDINPEIGKLPAMNLAKVAKTQELLTSHALAVNLQEFSARLLSKTKSPIAPLVAVAGEGKEKSLHVEGIAVFKGDKLAGTLSPAETRGLLWVIGKVKSGDIDVDFPDGKATLEIIKAKSEVTSEIKDSKPYIHVMIKEEGNLVNQTNTENLATLQGFYSLEERQSEVIRSEVQQALKKAKDLNTDIFGFGEIIHKKHRNEWKLMEDNWDKIFPDIQVEIEVKSSVKAAGLIIKPAVPEAISGKEE